jgi:replication fork clamp-binding protein CrfC
MQQVNFLNALLRLKAKLVSRGPFIAWIEEDLFLKKEIVKSLYEENLVLKESMIICVLSMAAFSHEEAIVVTHTAIDESEAAQLAKRKLEIRRYFHETIIELLQKQRYQQNLKMRMSEAGRNTQELMDQMDIVEESREMIEDLLAEVVEAAENM